MSRTRIFEWHRRFSEGRKSVEDDERVERPSSSKTDVDVRLVEEIVRADRRLSIRAIVEMVNIDKETVRQILHENLKVTKMCAKVVPKFLL